MPRKGPAPRRDLMPDPIYRSVVVTQLVNKVLQRGKRSLAEQVVYDALSEIEQKTGGDPIPTLKRAVENVRPVLEVKSRRVGGATYQVPVEVRPRRATTLAIRWIVGYARQRREKTIARAARRRAARRQQRARRRDQAQGRPAEDGGVQQGVRPLPVVSAMDSRLEPSPPTRASRRRPSRRARPVPGDPAGTRGRGPDPQRRRSPEPSGGTSRAGKRQRPWQTQTRNSKARAAP